MYHYRMLLHAGAPDARAALDAAVDEATLVAPQAPRLRVDLDGDALPSETVAALVAALRRLRDLSGALEVAPLSAAVRDALTLMGLDRVFAFPLVDHELPAAPPMPPARPRGLLHRFTATAVVAVLGLLGAPAHADDTDPAAIIAKIVARNPALGSYQGRLHVDLRMTSFPFLRTHLDATTYYKRPSNYEVVFDRVPSMAKGFEKMFTDIGDPQSWAKRFVITPAGDADFQGHSDIALRMVQRVRGMIDHETVLVDPATWSIDSIRYDYYNGGHITLTQEFRDIGGFSMVSEQHADIAIPYARAVVHGVYSDYRTNVALDDAVFAPGPAR